jgi:hypothetical protein
MSGLTAPLSVRWLNACASTKTRSRVRAERLCSTRLNKHMGLRLTYNWEPNFGPGAERRPDSCRNRPPQTDQERVHASDGPTDLWVPVSLRAYRPRTPLPGDLGFKPEGDQKCD